MQYWSDDLEQLAVKYLYNCSQLSNASYHKKFSFVGESVGVSYGRNFTHLISYWFFEGQYYDYRSKRCKNEETTFTCDHYHQVNCGYRGTVMEGERESTTYTNNAISSCVRVYPFYVYLQVAWARTYEVGCAIALCPSLVDLDDHWWYYYLLYSNLYESLDQLPMYLLVCYYGPGNPGHAHHPYIIGKACDECPEEYPHCDYPGDTGSGSGSGSGSGHDTQLEQGLCY